MVHFEQCAPIEPESIKVFSFSIGHKDIVDYLLEKGSNVNQVANDGNTALIWGAVKGKHNFQSIFICFVD